jgi:chromosome segregation ATPase
LTVLQVIEQILVYSEEEIDMGSVLRMIEVLKRSYLKENESILKENSELKDTLNNILEINNSLVEEIEKLKAEREQQREVVQRMDQLLQEAKERESRLEINYQQEIKLLRRSISGLKEESPIGRKQGREDEMNTISKLEDEVVALRQENQQKEVELAQIKANSNKKFVNELNNLLDSCTVAKDG